MYVYRTWREDVGSGQVSNIHTVGYYNPDGVWNAAEDHDDEKEAADRVHYLNGGNIKTCTFAIQKSLLAACKELLIDAKESVEACGPCDHNVNICVCGLISNIEDAEAAIALAEEDKPAKTNEN